MKNLVSYFNPCINPELALNLKEQILDGLNLDDAQDIIDETVEATAKLDFTDYSRIDEMFIPNDGMSKLERRLRHQGYRKLDDETPDELDLCVEVWSIEHKRPVRLNIKRMLDNDQIVDFRKQG